MRKPETLCVFCGASNAAPKPHLDAGAEFGRQLAVRDIHLIYGGGDCGIMGAIANGVMNHKGKVTGIFPVNLRNLEVEHTGLTETIIVDSMHERKQMMYERAEAFVVFPGGFGTMDEMFEVITWKQLFIHQKPIVIFNHLGYWDPLVALMDNIISNRFAQKEVAGYYKVVTEMDAIFDAIGELL
jgi:uncharacterized protein (TIGR00730 family)